jgi:4'-phosphopantetheinyl transferase
MKDPQLSDCSLELIRRMVHVWPVRTVASNDITWWLEQVLVPDEKERAARFRFDHLRHSFILARGALRILLGRYLNASPAGIQFKYGSKGKPSLAAPPLVDFNASHSGGLAVFAFTAHCEIGVDVEQIRPLPDMQNIADRFFCSEEAAELMSLTANQREHAFFRCWTRKEAYIKAISDGLSAPLNDFCVTVQAGQRARFIHIAQDASDAKNWTLSDLELDPNYAAALAYRDAERPVVVSPVIDPAELLNITS